MKPLPESTVRLHAYLTTHAVMPPQTVIKRDTGLSESQLRRALMKLEARGYIRRQWRGRARTIELTDKALETPQEAA